MTLCCKAKFVQCLCVFVVVHVCLSQIQCTKHILEHKCRIKESTKVRESERETFELESPPLSSSYLCFLVEEAATRASFDGQITHASNHN